MATTSSTQHHQYLAAFEEFDRNGAAAQPAWARALRANAIGKFNELGFPTARRGNEEWKYTDVGPIASTPFRPLTSSPSNRVSAKALAHLKLGRAPWGRMVFVNGSYSETLTTLDPSMNSVSIGNLADAMTASGGLVESHLARHAVYESNAFAALNTAFIHDGAFVHIPDGVVLKEPLHIIFFANSQASDSAVQPRVLLVLGKGSKARIIESYGGQGHYLTNSVTEVLLDEGASLEHYRVQQESGEAFHVHNTQVVLGRDTRFQSVTVDVGGALIRNNLNVLMDDEGAYCMLNGVYILDGSQHVDNQVIVDHAKPYTTTRELYKGVLAGRSRAVFHGSILVRQNAQKVDARQEDRNLLLSDRAEADTKPAFWIYADDVKCSHGAACGKLDDAALFYLRSRGMDEKEARSVLTRGFVSEVVNSVPSPTIRTRLDRLVSARLKELQDGG